MEWRIADGGDPAHLVEAFLADNGLDVRNLANTSDGRHTDGLCGAAIFVSAAAGAAMVGAAGGAPTPVPAVPDLVAVVYDHRASGGPRGAGGSAGPGGSGGRGNAGRVDGTGGSAGLGGGGGSAGWGRAGGAAGGSAGVGGGSAGWGGAGGAADGSAVGAWRESWTPARHAAAVDRVREAIARGEVYQVNLVGHASAPYAGDPLSALARVARLPGARYGGVLAGEGWAIGCASPETLVEVRDGRVVTRPIKGTRPATGRGRAELRASAKERAEHIMIVDLERNDLGRVARTGSVRVDELYGIRRWAGLWQAESTVSAALADGCGLADLLRAVCPGGSVTGAPKLAALAEIARREPVGRGASMGGLGWVGAGGRLDLGLTIRTAAADGERLHVWAGGGITWGSDPWAEVAEAAAKAAPVRAALTG
jgi:para-aminobenzoate synthetase component I